MACPDTYAFVYKMIGGCVYANALALPYSG